MAVSVSTPVSGERQQPLQNSRSPAVTEQSISQSRDTVARGNGQTRGLEGSLLQRQHAVVKLSS
jgi:hypothetical protein